LGLPPERALALVSGAAADVYIERFKASAPWVEVLGPDSDRWLIRAADHETLSTALAGVVRPPGRLRIEVDPLRV